jgi:hypothetical protein
VNLLLPDSADMISATHSTNEEEKMKNSKILAVTGIAAAIMLSACGTPKTPVPAPSSQSASPSISSSMPSQTPAGTPSASESSTASSAGTALGLLGTLEVKPEDKSVTYNRELFGEPWEDVDGNGCDTRNDMLMRDLDNITVAADECKVLKGTLIDPYSGKPIDFDRSKGGGGGLDIDHVIALSAAFSTGASSWPAEKRLQFANDPLNLITSASGPNRAKGDKDASEWLPATAGNPAFNCRYVARQVAVKAKYGSWITPAESKAMKVVLDTCPNEPVPTDKSVLIDQTTPVSTSAPVEKVPAAPTEKVPAPAQEVPAPAADGVDPDYGSCTKAKAAGAGPYTTADPEYKFYKDGDGDGTVCE